MLEYAATKGGFMEFKDLNQNKAFIKKEAKRLGISAKAAYATFYSRMLLQRLAQVNYGKLVVKGSFSQYVHLGRLTRPVLDIDLSSEIYHRIPINILFESIYGMNDGIVSFDISKYPYQTPNGVYKIPVYAKVQYPDSDKVMIIPIPVDFKEYNKVIFETQFKSVEPLFEGDEKFYINTPSFEEHLAEKLYIIAHNRRTDIQNTRVKDFYDVYELHGKDYDPDKFCLYFQSILMMYGENLDNLDADFLNKTFIKRHLDIWNRMMEKYEFIDKDIDLAEAIFYTKAVLKEQIQRIRKKEFTDQAITLVRSKNK